MTVITNHLPTNIARVGLVSTGFLAAAALASAPLGLAVLAGVVHTVAFGALIYCLPASYKSKGVDGLLHFTSTSSRLALLFALGIISSNPVTTCYGLIAITASIHISLLCDFRAKTAHA